MREGYCGDGEGQGEMFTTAKGWGDPKAVLAQAKSCDTMIMTELEAHLLWYGVPKKEQGNKVEKWSKSNAISIQSKNPPAYERWMLVDEAKFEQLKKKEINMSDTALGRL